MKIGTSKNLTKRVRTAYFISVISISLVLFVLGITALLLYNGNQVKREAEKNIILTVFLRNETKTIDIERFTKKIKLEPYVIGAKYVSPEEATRIMVKELGQDFTEALGYSALPPSVELNLHPDYLSEDSILSIKQKLSVSKHVKEIYYQKNLTNLISKNISRVSLSGILIALLMLFISFALIGNAVRLSVHAKRFMIRTAQLVGATQSFIRKPFISRTIAAGIIGASLSALALSLIIIFLQNNYEAVISTEALWGIVFFLYFCGISVGAIAGYTSVNRYLNADERELYNYE